MDGLVIMEGAAFDEECQSTIGGKPLMSMSSRGESSDLSSEMSEQKSSTSSSSVKDTSKLHIHKFKVLSTSSSPMLCDMQQQEEAQKTWAKKSPVGIKR